MKLRKVLSFVLAVLMVFSLVSVSALAAAPLEITKQPTVADPSVEVNASSAEFQWYASASETYALLTDADVRPINNDSQFTAGTSSFDNTTGEWTPVADENYMEFFWIDLNAGESITLYFSDAVYEPGLGNFETFNAFYGVENEDGSYTITVDETGEFVCMTIADTPVTVKVYGTAYTYEAIEGETDALLSKMTVGKKYYCQVTLGDELVNSDIFTAAYQINKQPTVNDPSVVPSFAEDVDHYQWHKLVKGEVEITDKTVGVTTDSVYNSENGVWIPYVEYEGPGDDVMYVFDMDLYKGDIVTVTIFGGIATTVFFGDNDEMYAENAELDENGNYVYEVPHDSNFTLVIEAPSTDIAVKAVAYTYTTAPIEGENTNRLSNLDIGESYLCEVTYTDGSVVWSDRFYSDFMFVKQPTAADMSVEVSFSDNVKSYQWYKKTTDISEGEIDGYKASSASISYVLDLEKIPDDVSYTVINEKSYYDAEIEAWIPGSIAIFGNTTYFGFLVDLEAGETLTIENVGTTVIGEYSLIDVDDMSNPSYVSDLNENGEHVITVEHTATYILALYPENEIIMSLSDAPDVAFKAYGKTTSFKPIEGETAPALSSAEYRDIYMCEVVYNNGTTILSDAVDTVPAVITQPTSANPFVDVTFKDHVVSYQWNLVETGDAYVTDKNATPADYTNDTQGSLAHYDPETNAWTPAYYSDWEETEYVTVDGRVYFDNSSAGWASVYIHCFNLEPEYNCEADWPGTLMTQIEGTDIWYYDVPDGFDGIVFNDNNGHQSYDIFVSSDFVDGINCYEISNDSFSTYEEATVVQMYEFDLFQVYLEAGQTLTVTPSEELFYGEMDIDGAVYVDENGDYVYTATEDGYVYVYAQDDADYDITFTAIISDSVVYIPVEGADKSVFIPEEAGKYVCYITYDDGYVLTTDSVELDPENFSTVDGDVNGDGKFNMFDYVMVKAICLGNGSYTELDLYRADYNNDGKVNLFDYVSLKSLYFASK